jgi:predicted dehydrogenase
VTVYADPEGDDSAGGPASSPLNGALTAGTPVELSPTLPWIHAMRRQAENFIAAVRGEIPPRTDAAEGLQDLKVAEQYLDLFDAARGT